MAGELIASFRFVFDSLRLRTAQGLSADVDGDGRPDNRFSNVIRAVEGLSLDFQGQIDSELKTGSLTLLLTVATEFPTLAHDQRAAVTLLAGKPVEQSNHVYTIDPLVAPVTLQGRIVAGRFASEDPRAGGLVVRRDIPLALGPSRVPTALSIQGLRLAFDISVDGLAISNGQLSGSIKEADVHNQIVPALAETMTGLIQNDPTSPTAQSIQKLFDLGRSTRPDGTAEPTGDGLIEVRELLTHPLMMSMLQPDVQIYNEQGNYAPNPLRSHPDSLSIALGFSATRASY